MGQTDFEFGHNSKTTERCTHDPNTCFVPYCSWPKCNEPDYKTVDPPTYAQACMGMMVCPHCGKAVMCSDIPTGGTHVDISKSVGQSGSSNLPWLNSEDISDKGDKLKVDEVREPRKSTKKTNIIVFVDVTVMSTKKKHTWSLREGFTLDSVAEALGTETDDWKGKTLSVVRGGNKGQYVNVA